MLQQSFAEFLSGLFEEWVALEAAFEDAGFEARFAARVDDQAGAFLQVGSGEQPAQGGLKADARAARKLKSPPLRAIKFVGRSASGPPE